MSMMRVRFFLSVLLLSAAALGTAGSARAVTYVGKYDPAYGGIFPQLGWEASAVFDVPDACLAIGNGTNIPISGPCAGFDVLSAEVSFYNVANPATILNSYALDPNVIVNGINIAGGHLAGIDTGFFNFFIPELAIAGDGDFGFSLILFGGNLAQLIYADPPQTSPGCAFIHGSWCQLRGLGQSGHRRIRARAGARDARSDACRSRRHRYRRPPASQLAT